MKIATKLWGFVLFPHVVLKWRKYAINYSPIFTYEKLGWIMAKRNETKQIGKENISTYCTVRCESECFELWSLERHLSCASQLGLLVFITTHTNAHLKHTEAFVYIFSGVFAERTTDNKSGSIGVARAQRPSEMSMSENFTLAGKRAFGITFHWKL